MTGVGLGWLQGTIPEVAPAGVVGLLERVIGEAPEPRAGGTRWYAESVRVGPDALIAWAPRYRLEAIETYFEVRQTALDALGTAAALDLAGHLLAAGARFTRADAFYDDRARHAEPATVSEAYQQGDRLTHLHRIREDRGFVSAGRVAIPDGATTYLGSKKSEAFVRVYDKAAESGIAGAGVRWELETHNQQARQFVAGAVGAGDRLGTYLLGCIRGLIDFRDRTGQERGDRAPLLGWWAAIVVDAERVRLNEPERTDSLEKRAVWLEKQVAPSLALVHLGYGEAWLSGLLRSGEGRLTAGQRRLLAGR